VTHIRATGLRATARRIVAASVVAGIIVGAAAGGALAQTGAAKVVFTYGSLNDIDSFNPLVGATAAASTSFALQYNLLLDFSPTDLSPIPGIATEVPTQANGGISSDGLTWTYTIREGMTWSDGQPLTAADVAFTYHYILDNSFACCAGYLKYVDSVTAPSPTQLVIHTTQPAAGLLSIYDYILPEHIWQDIDRDQARTFDNYPNPVTSGPFHLVDWRQGSWTFEANPDYWAGAPNVDEVVFRVYSSPDELVAALRSGEIDFADGVQADLFDSLKGQPGIQTNAAVTSDVIWAGFNTGADVTIPTSDGNPALTDVNVRTALAMAVDKQAIVKEVEHGHATAGSSIVPPTGAAFHLEPSAEETIPFDLEGASALLDRLGYADTDHDGVREDPKTGDPLSIRLFSRTAREDTHTIAQYLINWWAQIGVQASETALSDKELTNAIFEGNYDAFIWGWIADPDPDFLLSVLTSDQRPPAGVWSDTFYSNPGYDADYVHQRAILDPAARATFVKQMEAQVYADVPYIVLFYDDRLQAYRSDRWTGFTPEPADHGNLLGAYGPSSFMSIEPVGPSGAGAGANAGAGGTSIGIVLGAIAAAILAIGGVVLLARRRGQGDGPISGQDAPG
jgi:peptide/nickel transport system substrate-binding protein